MTQAIQHEEQALAWHIQLQQDDADWDGFMDWLEADDSHRQSYEAIAQADAQLSALLSANETSWPANDDGAVRAAPNTSAWRSASIAASVAALFAIGTLFWSKADAPAQVYVTGSQAGRTIALANGVSIRLDRNSRMTVVPATVAQVTLDTGGAYFIAPSNPDPSFSVQVGSYHVQDIGTQFEIVRSAGQIKIAVSHGAVRIEPRSAAPVQLGVGEALAIRESTDSAQLYRVSPEQVAGWRSGRLVYAETPANVVALDVARAMGLTLDVDPRIATQRFTGVMNIGDRSQLASVFSDLTGFAVEQRGGKLIVRPAGEHSRARDAGSPR